MTQAHPAKHFRKIDAQEAHLGESLTHGQGQRLICLLKLTCECRQLGAREATRYALELSLFIGQLEIHAFVVPNIGTCRRHSLTKTRLTQLRAEAIVAGASSMYVLVNLSYRISVRPPSSTKRRLTQSCSAALYLKT